MNSRSLKDENKRSKRRINAEGRKIGGRANQRWKGPKRGKGEERMKGEERRKVTNSGGAPNR